MHATTVVLNSLHLESILNVGVIILTLLAHWGTGGLLGATGLLTRALVGGATSALVLAILANVCAGAIRPVAVALVVANAAYSCHLLGLFRRQFVLPFAADRKFCLLLAGFGVVMAFVDWPVNHFISQPHGVNTMSVKYHAGYYYYSTQSLEMLNADYFSRLRVSNFFPAVWSRYHFFTGAYQALLQALLPRPGLLSFWISQLVLSTAVLLSFAEAFRLAMRTPERSAVVWLAWLLGGFIFFGPSFGWQLRTSGVLSLFGVIQCLFALRKREYELALLFQIIVGVSAFRLLPFSLVSCLLILFWGAKDGYLPLRSKRLRGMGLILFLFAFYNLVTFFNHDSGRRAMWGFFHYAPEWLGGFLSYDTLRFLGPSLSRYLASVFTVDGGARFGGRALGPDWISVTFVVLLVSLSVWLLFQLGRRDQKMSRWAGLGALVSFGLFLAVKMIVPAWAGVILIWLPYFLASYLVLRLNAVLTKGIASPALAGVVLGFQISALLFLTTGMGALQIPVASLAFEVGLWGAVAMLLVALPPPSRRQSTALVSVLLLLFLAREERFLFPSATSLTNVDVTDWYQAVRLGEEAKLLGPDRTVRVEGSPERKDAVAALLGARVAYQELHRAHYGTEEFVLPLPKK